MADENKPAFYPRVGRTIAKNFRSAQPPAFIEDPRAMDLPQYGDVDLSVPSRENLEMARRMAERDAQLKRQQQADRSPLEKLAGGLQAGRFMGSALTQAINSLPTRIAKGDEAADTFIQERIYKPEQPLAYEYAQDVGDFLEKLETEYKIPPLLPEAVALQYLTGPATQQAMRVAGKGAEQAGRALERGMEPVVRGALEQGGLPREMVMAMGANTQSNVMKTKENSNWLKGSPDRSLENLKQYRGPDNREAELLAEIEEATRMGAQGYLNAATADLKRYRESKALDAWVDSNLKNYVKKQMGTPEDPVRALHEQGISHLPQDLQNPAMMWTPEELARDRKMQGFPEEGVAVNPTAQMWEQMSDQAIIPTKAGEIQEYPALMEKRAKALEKYHDYERQIDDRLVPFLMKKGLDSDSIAELLKLQSFEKANILKDKKLNKLFREVPPYPANEQFMRESSTQNPWLSKVDPNTPVYSGDISGLGFDHVLDVLREDIAAGRIRPEQLNKVSIEQAVRRTFEYDQELARRMSEARATSRAELPVYKDYPEGFKWIQLNRPGDFAAESKSMGHSVKGYEPPSGHPDWTEGSGDSGSSSYGLGGWDAIKSGQAKVYSLVDAKGEPHVTIEVGKGKHPIGTTGRGNNFPDELHYGEYNNSTAEISKEKQKEIYDLGKKLYFENSNAYAENRILSGGRAPDIMDTFQKAADMLLGERPGYVRQIKGKGNARPIGKYDPFTQDFVKSGGWADVNDLQNTGLINVNGRYFTEPELTEAVKKYGRMGVQDTPWEVAKKRHIEAGLTEEDALANWVEAFKEGRGRLDIPPEGMKRGGKVSISNNPDAMMLEVNNQKMAKGGLSKLLRAAPKSKAEIDAIARRMAPQMLGEFVRGRTGSQSVAEKTQKQFAKEKEMMHDIRPTGAERALPREVDIEELKDQVMIGIAGDPTISGKTIYSVNGVPLESPSPQYGGPLYGLEHEGDAFWASGLNAANRVQNVAREASEQYDLPVLGNYVMMGPDSINYAQHYADANLAAINPAKMSRGQIEDFNNLIRRGSNKSGPRPSFPGIENPSEAYLHFSVDPELRKHFNALMQMPTVTEKYNLPSGIDVRHAVTEPDLRDLEIGVTGKSIGRLRPEIEDLGYSEHPTYSHDIPGEFMGSSKYPTPYELSFPDTVKSVRENPKQAPQEFGSFKYVGPRQVIDQQLIDEIKQYQEMIKKYTGKKEGGYIKKPAAYIDGSEFWEAAQKYGIKDSIKNLNMIVDLVNKGLSVDDAARQVADSGTHKAAGGAIRGDDLILEERPL